MAAFLKMFHTNHNHLPADRNMCSTQDQFKTLQEEEEDEACLFAMQLASFSVLPMTLRAALELDLLEIMAKAGPGAHLSPAEIAAQLPTQNPQAPIMLDRMLRLLASYNVITCSFVTTDDGQVQRHYGLAPVCKFLTRDSDGVSLAPILLMNTDKFLSQSWHYLKDVVLDGGIPFQKAYGKTPFEYYGTDARLNKVANEGMSVHSSIIMKKILETYQGFDSVNTVVDVGGGIGATLGMIVSKYPHIKGINFDLPHVISVAPSIPGVEHLSGDMFVSVPNGDAIVIKHVLQDWADEQCVTLLKNSWKALPTFGKVMIAERILPVAPEMNMAAQVTFHADINHLVYSPGGKVRTEKEFEVLAKDAGFSRFKVICCAFNCHVMEFLK